MRYLRYIFALQVLSDESKRQQYDALGSSGFHASQQGRGGGGPQWGGFSNQDINPEELFRKIFGDFSSGQGPFEEYRDFAPVEVC